MGVFAEFVSGMLKHDPEERWSASYASEHIYVATGGPGEGSSPGDSHTTTATSEGTTSNHKEGSSSGVGSRKTRVRSSSAPSVTSNISSSSNVEGLDKKAASKGGATLQRHYSDSAIVSDEDQSPDSANKEDSASKDGAITETLMAKTDQSPSPVVKI